MTDEEWILVSRSLRNMQEQKGTHDAASGLLMIPADAPLVEPFWNVCDTLLTALSQIAGDDSEWLELFVWDCDFGRKPQEAGIEGDMQLIDSYEQLRWLLELPAR